MNKFKEILAAILVHFPIAVVKLRYFLRFNRLPDLKNPHDLNEKILYLKLFTDTRLWSRLADKILVRDYVKECGLESILPKLYATWNHADDINFDALPDAFMLKSNNGDGKGTNIPVYDKRQLSPVDFASLKNKAAGWLKLKNIGALSAEPHYNAIRPLVFAEELLPIPKGENSVVDYKIWCFNGEPCLFLVISNRKSGGEAELSCYDLKWNSCSNILSSGKHYRIRVSELPQPENLELMIEYAKKLAKPFPQVRVDLYNIDGKIYFGELTFTSLGGMMNYFTPQALMDMGKMVNLSYSS